LYIGFLDHFCTAFGTTSNYSVTASLHTLQITAPTTKSSSACSFFQQPFPSNGFERRRFFSFPRSGPQTELFQFPSARLRSSLYSPGVYPNRKHRLKHFLCYCYGRLPSDNPDIVDVFIRFRGNVFTEPLLRNCRYIFAYCIATTVYATLYRVCESGQGLIKGIISVLVWRA
jgi:hypothetical protein